MKWFVSFAACALWSIAWAEEASFRESIELRRISEYWQEREYLAAKKHILLFLQEYPQNSGCDALLAMLGDLYLHEKNYKAAVHTYEQIANKAIKTKVAHSAVHCLYMLGAYDRVIAEAEPLIGSNLLTKEQEETVRFEFAYALFQNAQSLEDDAKVKQLSLALQYFENLTQQSSLSDKAALHAAQIHSYFNQHQQAAQYYRELAEKIPEKREEYYLLAAEQEFYFDRPAAILSYEKVFSCGGTSAPLAAYNQLLLLFQEGLFADVIALREKVEYLIAKEQLPIVDYLTGKSLYMIGEVEKCQDFLMRFLSVPNIDPAHAKNALLTLLQCAQERGELVRFEQLLQDLKQGFPTDEETAKAIVIHAQLVKHAGNADQAIQDLKEIAQQFPQYAQRDAILFDLATLYGEERLWEESISICYTFLKEYQDHPKQNAVVRHLVYVSLKAAQEGDVTQKERFVQVLTEALQNETVFNDLERQKARFFLAQTLCEIDKYEEALLILSEYLHDYASDPNLGDAHICAAFAYQKTENFPFFVFHIEKALAINPENKELHIYLYNAYITLSEKASDEEKTDLLCLAAEHLYEAMTLPPKPENLRWLAHFAFRQYEEGNFSNPKFFSWAIQALEQLTASGFAPENEEDAIQLAAWYGIGHRLKEQATLLQALKEEQERNSELAWKHPRLVLFKLAHSYQEAGVMDKAMALYTFLIDSSDHASSYFATGAALDRALLQYDLLPLVQKTAASQETQRIFDVLKELSIARRLYSEPFHLEAALHYVDLKTSIVPKEKQAQYSLHLLNAMRESFFNTEDALVQEYTSAKEEFPEKYKLYLAFLDLVDVRMLMLSSQIAEEQGDTDRAATLLVQAKEEYSQLLRNAPNDERFTTRMQRLMH